MSIFSRKSRRTISPKLRTAKPQIVPLEDRLTPAGFGPADGATIVESWAGSYNDVKIQPGNQYIVAAGSTNNGISIARYDSLGKTDTAFGSGGKATPALSANSELGTGLVIQPDGKTIVSGEVIGVSGLQHFVARFNTNGSLDGSFGGGGWKSIDVQSMDIYSIAHTTVGLQSSGKVVIAGDSFGTLAGYPANTNPAVLARFTASGAVDSGRNGFGTIGSGNKALGYNLATFGGDFNSFNDLVVQPDDKIVVVGQSNGISGGFLIARYDANGTLDTGFNGSGYTTFLPAGSVTAFANGISRQSDGKFVVVGSCSEVGDTQGDSRDILVARFNANGSVDTTFGAGAGFVRLDIDGDASVTTEFGKDLVIQPDGKIIVVGNYQPGIIEGNTNPRNALIARFNSDGSPDSTFASGGFKIGAAPIGHSFLTTDVALQSNGNIIVAGSDSDGTNSHPLLMRFFGGSPLMAAGGAAHAVSDAKSLEMAQVQPLLHEALARWQMTSTDVSRLSHLDIRIADLGGSTLGLASGKTIWLDDNAAGHGWFVDPTPGNDSEFTTPGNQGEQNRIDLLTTLMHEVGHVIGHDHAEGGVMQESLGEGVRLTPHGVYIGDADVDFATPPWRDHGSGRRSAARLRR